MLVNLMILVALVLLSFKIFSCVVIFFQGFVYSKKLEDMDCFNGLMFDDCIIIDDLINEDDLILDIDKKVFSRAFNKGMVTSLFLPRVKDLYDIEELDFLSSKSNKSSFLSQSSEASYNMINKSIILYPQYVIFHGSKDAYSFPVIKISTLLHEIGHAKDKSIALYTIINMICSLGWVISLLVCFYLTSRGPSYLFIISVLAIAGVSLKIISSFIKYITDKYAEDFSIKEIIRFNQDQCRLLEKYLCYQSRYYLSFFKNTLVGKILALLLCFFMAILLNLILSLYFS